MRFLAGRPFGRLFDKLSANGTESWEIVPRTGDRSLGAYHSQVEVTESLMTASGSSPVTGCP